MLELIVDIGWYAHRSIRLGQLCERGLQLFLWHWQCSADELVGKRSTNDGAHLGDLLRRHFDRAGRSAILQTVWYFIFFGASVAVQNQLRQFLRK